MALVQQSYDYTSGSGSNQYGYRIIINSSSQYFARITSTPLGPVSAGDVVDIPESVLEDIATSITTLQSGGGSTGTTGSSGSSS